MRIEKIASRIKPLDKRAMDEARKRQANLTKPQNSLGRLEELSIKIAGITGRIDPLLQRKVIFTIAGDHGVVEEGVSAYPKEVTSQMVFNFLSGGAGINVLARHVGTEVIVVDMGVAHDFGKIPRLVVKKIAKGTRNIAKGPAMSRDEAIMCIENGIRAFEEEFEKKPIGIVGVGDMGIGNTTPSSAIASVFTGKEVSEVTGRGTGISDEILKRKIEVIKKSLEINNPDPNDPVDVLSKVGGFEIGGIAGVCLAAASYRVPVVVDGFISTAGALIAGEISPLAREYMISSHKSAEKGHLAMLQYLGLSPLLDLNMCLGEGTGAAIGIFLAEASVKILNEMATFSEASVSREINKY